MRRNVRFLTHKEDNMNDVYAVFKHKLTVTVTNALHNVKTKSESRDMGGLWRFGGVHILCLDLA